MNTQNEIRKTEQLFNKLWLLLVNNPQGFNTTETKSILSLNKDLNTALNISDINLNSGLLEFNNFK